MAKYIIEFEDEPSMREDGVNYYTCKSARWYNLGDTIINRLEPYTEPDRKAIEDEVWWFTEKLSRMKYEEIRDCFGIGYEGEFDVLSCLTYSEAKAKHEAWKKQKDEIRVGDEVIPLDTRYDTMVVTKLWASKGGGGRVDAMAGDGKTYNFLKSDINKTGRHFDEVEELLKKMRGEE